MNSGFSFQTATAATPRMADFVRLAGIADKQAKELQYKEKRILRLRNNWRKAIGGKARKEARGLMFCAQLERDLYADAAHEARRAAHDCFIAVSTAQAKAIQDTKAKALYTIPAKRGKMINPEATPFVPTTTTKTVRPSALVALLDATATASRMSTRPRSGSNVLPDVTSIASLLPKKEAGHRYSASVGGRIAESTLPPFTDAPLSPTSSVKTAATKKIDEDEDEQSDDDIEIIVDIYSSKVKKD